MSQTNPVRPPPRTSAQRLQDTLDRLASDVDVWVATADSLGNAYLVPLSFLWDGATVTVATAASTRTARNLIATGSVRLAFGPTRDVVLLDGTVEAFTLETVPVTLAEAFAAQLWDVRTEPEPYMYFRITPRRVHAWRQIEEHDGRELMRHGRWRAAASDSVDTH